MPRWLVHAAIAAPIYLAFSVFSEGGLITDSLWGDVGHYEDFGRLVLDGEVPYGDFTVEYPPLALPVFVAPAVVTSTAAAYLLAFKLLMTAFGLVVVFATAWSLARLQADRSQTILGLGTIAVAPLLLGHVFLNRYDPWPAALVSLAVAALPRAPSQRRLGPSRCLVRGEDLHRRDAARRGLAHPVHAWQERAGGTPRRSSSRSALPSSRTSS